MHAPDGSLVAYINVGLHTGARELEIYNIAVQESFRCQGLGKLLLLHVLEWSLQNNFEKVLLEVREGNKAALALYASTGFTLIGRRRRYYRDNGEDALVLSCNLKAQP